MEISRKVIDGVDVLGVTGRIDAATSKDVEAALNSLIDQNKTKIIVDLAAVEYISSVGLRVLLASLKKLRQKDGSLMLASLQPFVRDVFQVAGFNKLFSIYPSADDAAKSLRS
jgi:anti-sigma B factor antagonist